LWADKLYREGSMLTTISRATPGAPRRLRHGAVALSIALLASAAFAQDAPVRVRGTIERVEGATYIIKSREGDDLKLKLAANGGVGALVPATRADVKPGLYIGVAGLPRKDGSQTALEISIFPEALRGTAEGFRAWDLQPESTMTNAYVEATVAAADGQTL